VRERDGGAVGEGGAGRGELEQIALGVDAAQSFADSMRL
jgi:hypothetical protein